MKFLKLFCILSITFSASISSIAYADTCYDPNYDRYYECGGDEYIAPVAAGLLFGAILSDDYGHDHRGYYYGGGHRGYGGHMGGHGGWHGGSRHR